MTEKWPEKILLHFILRYFSLMFYSKMYLFIQSEYNYNNCIEQTNPDSTEE